MVYGRKLTLGFLVLISMAPALSSSSTSKDRKECPCKRIPLSLSSFTAAEYGNLHSLQQKQQHHTAIRDSTGQTLLHIAAQHGHTAVVAWLLQQEDTSTTGSDIGCTPLHRAAFSGAIGPMHLLLVQQEQTRGHEAVRLLLLQPDTSFGDRRTVLHKACAGGRFLAVALLLETLMSGSGWMEAAWYQVDAWGQTAWDVVMEKCSLESNQYEEERQSVARWDAVAGGKADWRKCWQVCTCS